MGWRRRGNFRLVWGMIGCDREEAILSVEEMQVLAAE